jgi:predicted nucleotidyltransferase
MLSVLFGKSKASVLSVLVFAREPIHLREIARRSSIAPIQASRILGEFCKARIVDFKRVGNMRFFSLNKSLPATRLICRFVEGTRGVVNALKECLGKEKGVEIAFIYGSFATGSESTKSDVDLIVVGEPNFAAFSNKIVEIEGVFGKEINYSVYSPSEFARKKSSAFLSRVLGGEKLFLIGGVSA